MGIVTRASRSSPPPLSEDEELWFVALHIGKLVQIGVEGCNVNSCFSRGRCDVGIAEIDIGQLNPPQGIENPPGFRQSEGGCIEHARQCLRCHAPLDFVRHLERIENFRHRNRGNVESEFTIIGLLDEFGGSRREILVVVAQEAQQNIGVQLVGGNIGHPSILTRMGGAAPPHGLSRLVLLVRIMGYVVF